MSSEFKNQKSFAGAFLDGFSMAGFFSPLKRAGAPTQVFADSPDAHDQSNLNSMISSQEVEHAQRVLDLAGFEVRPRKTRSAH